MFKKAKKDTAEKSSDVVEEGAVKKPRSKRRVFLVALALLVVGGGVGGYFVFLSDKGSADLSADASKESTQESGDKASSSESKDSHASYVVAPFKEIIVNITSITANGKPTSRFLKLNLALVYDPSVEGAGRLEERQLFIRDAYVDYLRQLTEHELKGSAGLARLRADLLHRARVLGETDAPREMLIADMVIQ